MATRPAKSITGLPGLEGNTYTFLQLDANLETAGKAADAKKVGDELADVKSAVDEIDGAVDRLDGAVGQLEAGSLSALNANNGDVPVAKGNGTWEWSTKNYVTPEMFGAVGDGVTDDSDALEDALNYAADVTHKDLTLFIANKYRVTRTLVVNSSSDDVCFNIVGASHYTFGGSGTILFVTENRESDVPLFTTQDSNNEFKHITCKDVCFARVRSSEEVSGIIASYGLCFGALINEGFFENCGFVGWGKVFNGVAIASFVGCSFHLNGACFTGESRAINGISVHGGNFYQNGVILYGRANTSSVSFVGTWIEDVTKIIDCGYRQLLDVSFIGCDIRSLSTQQLPSGVFVSIETSSWQRYHINITDCIVYWNNSLASVSTSGVAECHIAVDNSLMIGFTQATLDASIHVTGNSKWFDSSFSPISSFDTEGFDTKASTAYSPITIAPKYSSGTPYRFGRMTSSSTRVAYVDANSQTMIWLPVYRVTSNANPTNPQATSYFVLNDNPQTYGDFIFRYVNNNLEGKKIYDIVTYDPIE